MTSSIRSGETHLVSRPESLQELPQQILLDCASVRVLASEVAEASDDEVPATGQEEVLEGLHAKLYVIDHGWDSSVFTGSFNATARAMELLCDRGRGPSERISIWGTDGA